MKMSHVFFFFFCYKMNSFIITIALEVGVEVKFWVALKLFCVCTQHFQIICSISQKWSLSYTLYFKPFLNSGRLKCLWGIFQLIQTDYETFRKCDKYLMHSVHHSKAQWRSLFTLLLWKEPKWCYTLAYELYILSLWRQNVFIPTVLL